MSDPNKYQRCMVMGGGGFRFPYYLGMHAAAVDAGRAPDLLLASCGGALAAAIIHRLPSDAERLAFAKSQAVYDFVTSIASTPRAAPGRALFGVARRWLSRTGAATIPDLFADYLFDLPAVLPIPAASRRTQGPALAIVGARMLFGRADVGQARGGRKLFMQTVFSDAHTCALLAGGSSPVQSDAVARELAVDTTMGLEDAVRISIADMVYFRCHSVGAQHYTGGVIDLVPVELAHRLALGVMLETKAPFGALLAAPALRQVFGFDGNARLRQVHAHPADVRVDTSDVCTVLARHGAGKRIDWADWRLKVVPPADYGAFVNDVQAMWDYGHARARAALAAPSRTPACV